MDASGVDRILDFLRRLDRPVMMDGGSPDEPMPFPGPPRPTGAEFGEALRLLAEMDTADRTAWLATGRGMLAVPKGRSW